MNIYCIRPKGFNIGNDIIFLAMRQFLSDEVNIITLPATSKYNGDRAGLTSKTIHEINQFGDGVIVGGGNLYENNELDVDIDALNKLEVPLFLYSLSRGRVYNKKGELVNRTDVMPDKKIKALNSMASFSSARDRATGEYLGKYTIISACPSLFIDKIEFTNESPSYILISVRNPSLMNIPVSKQNEVAETIKGLLRKFKDAKILCHDWRDISFAESIEAEYVYTENVYEFLSLLKNCKLNISFRLHSTLPCLSYGVPIINISYDERASSLIETIGFKRWDINLMEISKLLLQIEIRQNNFSELDIIKKETRPRWEDFYKINRKLFQSFTKEIT